jgi:monofunctional biosynthetic peptidoglycan transglycosylase
MARHAARLLALLALSLLALQAYFALRVAAMTVLDPRSTSFQRSEAWRLLVATERFRWAHDWVDDAAISPQLKRAVIASEDAGFVEHSGIEWDAIERAWDRNVRSEARVERANERLERREARAAARGLQLKAAARAEPKLVGGSTITQQLAKNLFLAGERTLARKAQEAAIALALEALLPKRRILEIYLNHVEWGEGVFGAQAAARHYFDADAGTLGALQAARLAVMLPAPKRFKKRPQSGYVAGRAATIAARMRDVALP